MSLILSGSDGLSDIDGSAATPAIRGTDANTGIFFPAADTIAFAEGGAEAMRIDSSGNLGIGTTSPLGKLNVGTAVADIAVQSGYFAGNKSSYASIYNLWQNQLFVYDSTTGNAAGVGGAISFGADCGSSQKTWLGSVEGIKENSTAGNYSGALVFRTRVNGDATLYERARIDSSGNLLVGTTTFQGKFTVTATGSTTIDCARTETSNSNQIVFRNGNGAVGSITTNGSATAYNTSSDYRLKNTIAPMTGALAKVSALNPVTYKWNVDGTDGEGFIAHELAEICPQAVSGQKDAVDENGKPAYQGIDVSFLVATLTAAIQEQQALITQLQADVAALKASA